MERSGGIGRTTHIPFCLQRQVYLAPVFVATMASLVGMGTWLWRGATSLSCSAHFAVREGLSDEEKEDHSGAGKICLAGPIVLSMIALEHRVRYLERPRTGRGWPGSPRFSSRRNNLAWLFSHPASPAKYARRHWRDSISPSTPDTG